MNLNEGHAILEKQIPRGTNYHTGLTITKSVAQNKDMWRFFYKLGVSIIWLTNEVIKCGVYFYEIPMKECHLHNICSYSSREQARHVLCNKISSAHFLVA